MTAGAHLRTLDAAGLEQFQSLRADAVRTVEERFHARYAAIYARFGPRGREASRDDLNFHLEFLRPVLEFGLLQPMVEYLRWLGSVLEARAVPLEHLPLSLEWLAEFFAARMTAPEGSIVAGALHAARDAFVQGGAAPEPPLPRALPWPEAAGFEAALLAGHQGQALEVINRCMDRGASLPDVERHVIQPALYHIGERWQANEVSVAQEHLATAIVQSVMTVGLLRATPAPANHRRVLLACVAGNEHAVGLRMVADAFQLAGWEVRYLGANVPTVALIGHAMEWRPHLLGLSVAFAHQLPVVKAILAELDECLGSSRPACMIGGLAVNRFAPIADIIHADAVGEDASAALARGTRLVQEKSP
jgi:methanogenic corrinoid protein MtbC1